EKRFVRRDGTAVWTRVTVSAVRDDGGALDFFVGVAEDITEARTRAERDARVRDDVLAVVAHDLRSPLHTLQLSAEAMADPAMSDEARAHNAEITCRVVQSMDRLIGELLDIGRMEAGSFPISKAAVDLR